MAKVKRMADGGVSSLGDMTKSSTSLNTLPSNGAGSDAGAGLDQIRQGTDTTSNAIGQAQNSISGASQSLGGGGSNLQTGKSGGGGGSVLGGGGGADDIGMVNTVGNGSSSVDSNTALKRGGSVKKYNSSLNKVRTSSKNSKNPNW